MKEIPKEVQKYIEILKKDIKMLVDTQEMVFNEMGEWIRHFYSYSSEDTRADLYPDFQNLKKILEKLKHEGKGRGE